MIDALTMKKRKLPGFTLYLSEEQEYRLCFEVEEKLYCWCSLYPPSMDVRFPRPMKKSQAHRADKYSHRRIVDKGLYYTTQKDDKRSIEQKFLKGIEERSLSFVLAGEKLKGRFSIKETDTGIVLQKLKDKYAVEEDVLSGDLSRTVSSMMPGFNPANFKLQRAKKSKSRKSKQDEPPEELITTDKKIGNNSYHFEFYRSDTGDIICLVSNSGNDVLVLQQQKSEWKIRSFIGKRTAKLEKAILEHTHTLFAHGVHN